MSTKRANSIGLLLRPKSIAIAGGSKSGGFQIGGAAVLDHLTLHGYRGDVSVISRSASQASGYPTFRSVSEIPTAPDCLVVSTPTKFVEPLVSDAIQAGVRSFVIVTSGFSESGSDGADHELRLRELLDRNDSVALGPNTTGYVNFHDRIALSSTSRLQGSLPPPGAIGVVLQSGALGSVFIDYAAETATGLSYVISSGNEMSTGIADYVNYFTDDERTKVIVLYVEGFRDPEGFVAAARRVAEANKSIVLIKLGRTEAGRHAAAGHTGALTGSREVHSALFRQLGIIAAETVQEAMDIASVLAAGRTIKSGVAVVSPSGGLGGLCSDALAVGGFRLPAFSSRTVDQIAHYLPGAHYARNPLDVAGAAFKTPGGIAAVLTSVAADPAIEALVFATTPIVNLWATEVAQAIPAAQSTSGKPFFAVWEAGEFNSAPIDLLRNAGIPVFRNVRQCCTALTAVLKRPPLAPAIVRSKSAAASAITLPAKQFLDKSESKALLRPYLGSALPNEIIINTEDGTEIIQGAEKIGFPVVLKALVDGVTHKSDLGFVSVGIANSGALTDAVAKQRSAIKRSGGRFYGFLIAEHVSSEVECIVGITRDVEFGLVLTFGAGGIFTEIVSDTSVRILPVERDEFRSMIEECKIGAILNGTRGRPQLDIDAVVDVMAALSDAAFDIGPELLGVEINPLAVMAKGAGAKALDAKIYLTRGKAP